MMKIVILDGYTSNPGDLSWEELAALGELTVYDRTAPEEVAARIAGAEIILTNKVVISAEVFDRCPALRLICVLATGYNIIDLAAARAHGVTVCNIPGYSTDAVAQMTFALLLETTQQVGLHNAAVHAGQWQNSPNFCFWNTPLTELTGKTMGLIGYGAIGQAVGRIAQAFGLRLLVTARHEKPVPAGAEFVDLQTLLSRSDIVSLHCPLTGQTQSMIDAAALEKMRRGAVLLNTARGGLIDECAVAQALSAGKLSYYCADAVSVEPIRADNPLLTAPNCLLTPHIAWAPLETRIRLHQMAAENLRAFLKGAPIHVVS